MTNECSDGVISKSRNDGLGAFSPVRNLVPIVDFPLGQLFSLGDCKQQLWTDGHFHVRTDSPGYRGLDRVFPVFGDENLLLVRAIRNLAPRRVLDVGTGSGILALAAAAHCGADVTAIDINARAVAFAHDNVRRNWLGRSVRVVLADVCDRASCGSGDYDLVVSNPPFVPLPPNYRFHVAGHGGADGHRVLRSVLTSLTSLLQSSGTLLATSLSLVGPEGPTLQVLARNLLPADFNVYLVSIYDSTLAISTFYRSFPGVFESDWYRDVRSRGLIEIGYFLVIATRQPDIPPTFENFHRWEKGTTKYSGSWDARLARYEDWTVC